MRLSLLVLAFALATAGCFGSGSGGGSREPSPSTSPVVCGESETVRLARQPPGLSQDAAANTFDDGNRTVRWDLEVADACQERGASANVEVQVGPTPQDCEPVTLRATVSTGLSELEVALVGDDVRTGALAFDARRPDLQSDGPAPFVVSLSATTASTGFAPHDQQCIEAVVQTFTLQATYRQDG